MMIVCLFAFIYAVVASAVIWHACRCARYRRPDFRFDVELPVALETESGERRFGVTRDISTVGMTFSMNDACPLSASGRVSGKLYLPNGVIPFDADLEKTGGGIRPGIEQSPISVLFRWRGNAADALDLALHVCGWHRRFSYRGDHLMTPLEWLQNKLKNSRPEAMPEWQTVIVAPASGHGGESFALSCRHESGSHWIAAYKEYEVGSVLTVINPRRPDDMQCVTIVGRDAAPDAAEIELEGATPIIHAVRPVPAANAAPLPALIAAA
jgi:hypothetical protein